MERVIVLVMAVVMADAWSVILYAVLAAVSEF